MEEVFGNLWTYLPDAEARVITTNGTVKQNGYAVMGLGCAAEAARRFPVLPRQLGKRLVNEGNHVSVFDNLQWADYKLITFPTKHKWHQNSDLFLIFRSACELADIADEYDLNSIVMPRPGCGNGNLSWEVVKETISGVLDHRFYIITFE